MIVEHHIDKNARFTRAPREASPCLFNRAEYRVFASMRTNRSIEELNADVMLDDVLILWNANAVMLMLDGRMLTTLIITDDIQAKITRWLNKNNMRCTQMHDGKIWL